jgi:hypothetical protein
MNPMQPSPAPGAEPPAQEGGGMPDFSDIKAADATRLFQDPRFLMDVSLLAAKHRQPEAMQWLKRANEAAHENVFEALQNLEIGDGVAAVKAFNKSGKLTDAKDAQKNEDGTWTLTRKNGDTSIIDPVAIRKSLLSPKDFFEQTNRDRVASSTEKYHDGMVSARNDEVASNDAYRRRLTDNAAERTQAQRDIADAKIEGAQAAAEAKAEAARAAAEAKANVAAHKAELNDKNGPLAIYTEILKTGKDDPDAEVKADRALSRHPQVVPVVGKDGRVGVFHQNQLDEKGQPTGRPYRTFESVAEYETRTGLKGPRAAPAKKEGAEGAAPKPKPRSVAQPGPMGLAQVLDAQRPVQPRRLMRPPEEQDDTYFAP